MRNDYLAFTSWKLKFHRGPIVVFGASLDEQLDQHIVDSMKYWYKYDRFRIGPSARKRDVAIGVFPPIGSDRIIAEKNRIGKQLENFNVEFFDSTTHPLADPKLIIAE
jgi:hypothetical protein